MNNNKLQTGGGGVEKKFKNHRRMISPLPP